MKLSLRNQNFKTGDSNEIGTHFTCNVNSIHFMR